MHIDPFWSPAGKASADRHGIGYAEALAIIDAPTTIFGTLPDTIWCIGATVTGRLIVVVLDRQARNTTIFEITHVRPASPDEAAAWRSKQP